MMPNSSANIVLMPPLPGSTPQLITEQLNIPEAIDVNKDPTALTPLYPANLEATNHEPITLYLGATVSYSFLRLILQEKVFL